MPDILASAPYAAALARAEDRRRRHCAACAYRGACNARPVLDLPQDCAPGPCPVEARLCAHIESLQPDAAATDPLGWHHIDLPALLPGRGASPRPAGV